VTIDISTQMIGGLLLRVFALLAVIGVGALLSFILQGLAEKLPFTRLVSCIALAPLIFLQLVDEKAIPILLLHAMLAALIGLIIDGANFILLSGQNTDVHPRQEQDDNKSTDSGPDGLVWEKAE
jgi:hypothetical protein